MGIFAKIFEALPDGRVWVTGKKLKELCNLLDRDRARLALGSGNEIPQANGRWFDVRAGASGGSGVRDFDIVLKKVGGVSKRGVVFRTHLYKTINAGQEEPEKVEITGLLGSDTPADDDPGWATTEGGDKLWLEVAVNSSLEPTSATIKSKKINGPLLPKGGEVENNGASPPAQSIARYYFGEVIDNGAGGLMAVNKAGGSKRIGIGAADSAKANGEGHALITAAIIV